MNTFGCRFINLFGELRGYNFSVWWVWWVKEISKSISLKIWWLWNIFLFNHLFHLNLIQQKQLFHIKCICSKIDCDIFFETSFMFFGLHTFQCFQCWRWLSGDFFLLDIFVVNIKQSPKYQFKLYKFNKVIVHSHFQKKTKIKSNFNKRFPKK
jgi:hypothetical protein